MKFRRIGSDLKVVYLQYRRNPAALFFSFFFPILIVALFGYIFSGAGSAVTTVVVLNEDQNSPASVAFLAALNNTSVVQVQVVGGSSWTPSNFAAELGSAGASVGLIVPAGFQANYSAHTNVSLALFVNPTDAASAGTAEGAIQGVANGFNLHAADGRAIITIASIHNVGSQIYTYIDYLIPGLIGFTILTSPMFSMVDIAASYRKDGIFRELSLTPLTRSEWLTSHILWYIVLTFINAGIMIAFGVGVFSAHLSIGLGMIPFLLVGTFLFVSIGMLSGTVAKTPESAAIIGNIITFPMMFLSGTFFPVSSFPPWLQTVAHVLPLYYVIDGLDQAMLFGNWNRAALDLTIVLVIAVVVFVMAVRFFRWRDS